MKKQTKTRKSLLLSSFLLFSFSPFLLFSLLLFSLLLSPLSSFAQGGTTGPLTWQINGNTLTISGNGAMPDYPDFPENPAPWQDYCYNIFTILITNGVTSIGYNAFPHCYELTSVTIPNSVTSIGGYAFAFCESLTSIAMPSSVTNIGDGVFWGCTNLSLITLPNNLICIGQSAFYDCSGLTSITLPNNLTSIGAGAFRSCSSLTSITIPKNVTFIGNNAFAYCSSLQTVNFNAINCTMTNGLQEDGSFSPVFVGCNALATLNIGDQVQKISDYAFAARGFTNPTSPELGSIIYLSNPIMIPNSVTYIGKYAFHRSPGLSSITLPYNLTTIEQGAFQHCIGLNIITTHAKTPPVVHSNAFYLVPTDIPVYVPCSSYDSYMNAPGWGNFTNIIRGDADIQQQICMISVDENNHNEITWKKQDEVSVYKIYREGTQSGQYDLIATVDYSFPNIWVDMESNAKIRSYRYKISAVGGVCNNESTFSDPHKTMHLTINAGMNNSWNLIWTPYEGTSFSTYNIYRATGNTMGELELIGTMPAGNTSFSDFGAPAGYVYYIVEIMLNENCDIGKAGSSIKSNMASNNPNVGIDDLRFTILDLRIYPNPTTGQLQISPAGGGQRGWNNDELRIESIEVFDVYGRALLSFASLMSSETTIDISNLATGIYFVKIRTEQGEVIRKVVKE